MSRSSPAPRRFGGLFEQRRKLLAAWANFVAPAPVDEKVARLDEKVDALVAQRADDRVTSRVRHYWLAGIGLTAVVSIWLDAAGVIG